MVSKRNDSYRRNMILTIQKNLSDLMASRGWENVDLSAATGINLSDLSKYRNIEYNTLPRVTELAKICQAFHVSFDYLIGLDPGGRYAGLNEDEKSLVTLYSIANDRDKLLVKTILEKYASPSEDSSN